MSEAKDIVLIAGGCGFLGQHIVKLLQEHDTTVKEIRIVDLKPYENRLKYAEKIPIVPYIGDICEPETIEKAFEGVDCVFHCATYVNFQFPPDLNKLEHVNVNGTKQIVELCVRYNVPRLVYSGTTAVTLVPFLGRAAFTMIFNQTETKAIVPTCDNKFLVSGYPSSKQRAEQIILGAHGAPLANGKDVLTTTSLRPALMYGELDKKFIPRIIGVSHYFNGIIPKVAGPGGKHQVVYVGNAAWAHIRAKDALKKDRNSVGGLPVFITDETRIQDSLRFSQYIAKQTTNVRINPSTWKFPVFLSFLLAFMMEMTVKILHPIFGTTLPFQPRALVRYSSSVLLYSRLRASIHMDYEPIFTEDKSAQNSAVWYEKWYQDFLLEKKALKKDK